MPVLELAKSAFVDSGVGWAVIGALLALGMTGFGSSWGMGLLGTQGIGILSEKPELFAKVFLLALLPGTQGLYGMVFAFLVIVFIGLTGAGGAAVAYTLAPATGIAIMLTGLVVGGVLMLTTIYQAKVISAGMQLVANDEEQFGRAITIQALIETFAVFALLLGILLLNGLIVDGVTIQLAAGGAR